jgi:uncharacterized membrane protein
MQHSLFKTIAKVIFGLIGIILIAQSLAFLGLSFLSANDFPDYYRIKLFLLFLIGEIILGLVCYFVPENNSIDDFLFVSYQGAAFSSGYILVFVLFNGFPDYTNLKSVSSVLLIILSIFIFVGFIKFRSNKSKTDKKRADWWR